MCREAERAEVLSRYAVHSALCLCIDCVAYGHQRMESHLIVCLTSANHCLCMIHHLLVFQFHITSWPPTLLTHERQQSLHALAGRGLW